MAILRSRTLSDQVIEQFDLRNVYGVSRLRDARDRLIGNVSVSLDRKDETITIAVTDRSPERARDIAGAYVDRLNRMVSELSTSAARRERIFLESRLSQVNLELQAAEKAFSEFASKNSAVDIKEQTKAMLGAAATLQGQLISAQSELEGIRQIYADSHVRVRSLKARIAELQSKLDKLGGRDGSNASGPGAGAADLYPPIRKLPILGATYADLFRRSKVQESVYEVLTQEYELAKVEEAREIPTIRVLDAPDLPEVKSYPHRTLIAGCALFIALTGGMTFLLGSRSWNEKNPHDLSKAVASEIWIDLREKRFLNSSNSFRSKPSISSLLGLSHHLGRRNRSSMAVYAEEEGCQSD
jgi:capsule polysaccharide export protein KpsE/RkpR